MLEGFTRSFEPLETLSEAELDEIHRGGLYTLENTGMRVEHAGALKMFAEAGCRVDFEDQRVRIPAWLAEECVRKAPSSYLVTARDGRSHVMVGGSTLYFMQGMGMQHIDLDTWERRPATLQEHKEAMIVADALDNCHMADAVFAYTDLQGVPPAMAFLETLASGIRNTGKAQHYGYSKDCDIFAIQLAKDLGINLEPEMDTASPLAIHKGSVDVTYRYVEADMPIQPCIGVTMGAEGPATMAGTLVMAAASVMGWAVLTQLIKPGAPFSIQYGFKPMDMRRGSPLFASVVNSLAHIGMNQLLRRYEIPSCTSAGFTSLSKKLDYQAAYEKSMGTVISAVSGGNLHIFQGGTLAELVYDPVLSILDDDIAGWVGRLLQGIDVNSETLAIDLINDVGPVPGHFLNTSHTRKHWKEEHFFPQVADEEVHSVWLEEGKRDALVLAQERMDDILTNHKPEPLTADQESSVQRMLTDAREHYRKEGMISDEEWSDYVDVLENAP